MKKKKKNRFEIVESLSQKKEKKGRNIIYL